MTTRLLAFALLLRTAPAFAVDTWTTVLTPSFFLTYSTEGTRGVVHNDGTTDQIYFGFGNATVGGGLVRSSDGTTWTGASAPGFTVAGSSEPASATARWAASFGGAVFAGTASTSAASGAGGRVYRSATGVAPWTLVFSTQTSGSANEEAVTSVASFSGSLVIGTLNRAAGGSVWYAGTPTSTGAWIESVGAADGFGINNNIEVTALKSFSDGALYAATAGSSTARGKIQRTTNLSSWTEIIDAPTTFSNTSFAVTMLEELNGYLYAGTANPVTGAQLWRTQTPLTAASWAQVYGPDGSNTGSKDTGRFGLATSTAIHAMTAVGGTLYVGVSDPQNGARIYRSTDGATNWSLSTTTIAGTELVGGLVGHAGYIYATTKSSYPPHGAILQAALSDVGAPAAVTNFTPTAVSSHQLFFSWTAPGNDGSAGTLLSGSSFFIHLSTDPAIAFSTFNAQTVISTSNVAAGASRAFLVPNLLANTTYYGRLFTGDPAQNSSAQSNASTMTTLARAPVTVANTLIAVYKTSATLAWAAHPGAVSSETSAGYQLEAATSSFDTNPTVTFTSSTLSMTQSTLTVTGLTAHTTHYFRVASRNGIGSLNYTTLTSTITQLQPPGSGTPLFIVVTSSSAHANWTDAGNGQIAAASVTYTATLSTAASPATNGFLTNISSITRSTSTLFGLGGAGAALTPNTTYFAQVFSTSPFWTSEYLNSSTSTLANAPVASSATVFYSSITVSWSSAANPSGTTFYIEASTDGFITTSLQLSSFDESIHMTGLTFNTTYQLRVQGVNHNGVRTAYSQLTATSTLVNSPLAAQPSAISSTSITANWLHNGNSSTTLYTVQASSDSYVTILTSQTRQASATFTGLPTNKTFAFQVRAHGHNGDVTAFVTLPSTTTSLTPPSFSTPAFTSVGTSSIAVAWATSGSPFYGPEISLNNFQTVLASTLTATLFQVFGTGGFGAALSPNTSYYVQVKSSDGANQSSFLALGSTYTLASTPTAPTFLYVSSISAFLDWGPNGNPEPGTSYQVWTSTDSNFGFLTSETSASTSTALITGLSAKTSYYFQVRAVNGANIPTGFASAISTFTLANPPDAPGTPSATAVGVSSLSWTWTLPADATGYNVLAATVAVVQGSTRTVPFIQYGLAPNTTAAIKVQAAGLTGTGGTSAAGTAVYTWAVAPTALSSPTVHSASVTVAWSINGNPTGTTAVLDRSTDNVAFANVFTGGATYYADSSLFGCTSYYYRVRHRNGDSIDTANTDPLLFFTKGSTPSAPGSLIADSLAGGRVSLTWTISPSSGVVEYALYTDNGSGSVNTGSPLAVFGSTVTSFTTGVLTSSPTYRFLLRARNRCGVEEQGGAQAQAASVSELSAARAAITAPGAGKRVSGSLVTVSAELTAGSPSSVSQVLFQFKNSSATAWQDIPAASASQSNPATKDPFYIHWDVTSLQTTSYDLRAVATTVGGSSDTAPSAVSVIVDPTNPDVSGGLSGGVMQTTQLVSPGVVATIASADPTTNFVGKLVLSPDSLSSSSGTVRVTILNNPTPPAAPPTGARSSGLGLDITLSTALAGSALISISYPDDDNNGIVDGTQVGARDLRFYSFSTALGRWVADVDTTVDLTSHTIYGRTTHFSFFSLFAVNAQNLVGVRVYPNPYKPSGANTDEGKPYAAGDPTSGILFDNLPASVTIKIYTITGQPVAKFVQDNGPGRLQWDARSDQGYPVASGLYLAVLTSPGLPDAVRKILIIR